MGKITQYSKTNKLGRYAQNLKKKNKSFADSEWKKKKILKRNKTIQYNVPASHNSSSLPSSEQ